MKELTIEEKAARYDEAIDIARKINSGEGVAASSGWTTCEVIFPELKESKDDKIRKEIIDFIYDKTDTYELREMSNSWLAWLEKQGETFTKKDIDDAYLKGISDAKQELEKQGEYSINNVPSREVILAIWDLGNEWKELTDGSISTIYGTQLNYIQKYWTESEYYKNKKK